jgi:hypothetical protein
MKATCKTSSRATLRIFIDVSFSFIAFRIQAFEIHEFWRLTS